VEKITEDNLDSYREANQELYDITASQYRAACQQHGNKWKIELKERMKLLDFRLKGLGEA